MSGSVAVLGAGVAGSAAALAAARAGARVTVVDGGAGASTLWTGAVDPVLAGAEPSADVLDLGRRLGVALEAGAIVTSSGLVRPVGGHEAAILDLLPLLKSGTVAVVRCERPGWDADALVRTAGVGLVAIDATVLRLADERMVPDADFASRHDEPARLEWLSDRLREAIARARRPIRALLLPPCLGSATSRAGELSEMVHVPCGEVTAMPGGPAGLRFEGARDRALATARITMIAGRAVSVAHVSDRWRVELEGGTLEADAVVLATGGLVGGGLAYEPSDAMPGSVLPAAARVAFRSTVEAPVRIGARGRPLDLPGTLFGLPPESIAWPFARDALMDRVGVLSDASGRVASGVQGLLAAGEVVADRPRSWLSALEGGARAGTAAAAVASATSATSANDGATGAEDALRGSAARPSSRAPAPASQP